MLDCKVVDKKFTRQDIDTVFASVKRKGERTVDLQQFQTACYRVAKKKGCDMQKVYDLVSAGDPILNATQADAVRFHDDESQYTGMHVRDGGDRTSMASRRDHMREEAVDHSSDQTDWSECEDCFKQFSGTDGLLESAEFRKFMIQADIIERGNPDLNTNACDLVYTKVVGRGRKMDFETFVECCRCMADRKKIDYKEMVRRVMHVDREFNATKTDEVRLHDDESTYTGMHVRG